MQLPIDLPDGLVLRRATTADAEALAVFNAAIHAEGEAPVIAAGIADWTRDLLSGEHPTMRAEDFTVVVEAATGRLVSSLGLISQTWTYAGLPVKVGRPELVGTLPEYRNRGLVRRQFEVVHQWSAERGEQLQAITGIPWYYRQFGYEMTLALGGARLGFAGIAPALKAEEAEPYRVRPAVAADEAFLRRMYARAAERHLVACVREGALWQYELAGKRPGNINRRELRVIEAADGAPVGYLAHPAWLWDRVVACTQYELEAGRSWLAITPSVLRYLWAAGEAMAARAAKPLEALAFELGPEHPVYPALGDRLPHRWQPYAWYVRVPDLPGFLRTITPVLERRLAGSIATGHTGELRLNFYRSGVRLGFDAGRISVTPWQPRPKAEGDAAFPDLSFLHLVFGHHSREEVGALFADSFCNSTEAKVLLDILFPKQASKLWPVD